jgi:uncharacterized coiled-coil protein SlyX
VWQESGVMQHHDNDKVVQQQMGLDQLAERLERIEKRLEISNA